MPSPVSFNMNLRQLPMVYVFFLGSQAKGGTNESKSKTKDSLMTWTSLHPIICR